MKVFHRVFIKKQNIANAVSFFDKKKKHLDTAAPIN